MFGYAKIPSPNKDYLKYWGTTGSPPLAAEATAAGDATEKANQALADAKTYVSEQLEVLTNSGAVKTNTEAIKAINDEIDAMDATYADTNAGVVTALTQVDGKITSVTQRKIKSADLDETDVFVFYCGNAFGYDDEMKTVNI